jgi:hypothetical protein
MKAVSQSSGSRPIRAAALMGNPRACLAGGKRSDEERDGERAEAEENAQNVQRRAALLPLMEVARQRVGPSVEASAAETEDDRRAEDEAVARGPRQDEEGRGDEQGRNGQDRLEAKAVDEGSEEQCRDQHGEVHGQEEVPRRALAEADALEERRQDRPQDGHDDAENEDAGPSRSLEARGPGGIGAMASRQGHLPLPDFFAGLFAAFRGTLKGRA